MKSYQPHSSSINGISANLVTMLLYIILPIFDMLGFIIILIVFFCEKRSRLVKFGAMQASILWVVKRMLYRAISFSTGNFVFSWFGGWDIFNLFRFTGNAFFGFVRFGVGVAIVLCAILGAVNSYRWLEWRAPLISKFADNLLSKAKQPAYNGAGPVPPECAPGATTSYTNTQYTAPGNSAENDNPYQPNSAAGTSEQSSPGVYQAQPAYTPPANDNGGMGHSPHGAPPTDRRVEKQTSEKKDPNEQLPAEMRDPPQPKDMF